MRRQRRADYESAFEWALEHVNDYMEGGVPDLGSFIQAIMAGFDVYYSMAQQIANQVLDTIGSRRTSRYSRGFTNRVATAARRRVAVSSDPYQRAQERADAAACRGGMFSAVTAMKKRAMQVNNADKLNGMYEFVADLKDELQQVLVILERKL